MGFDARLTGFALAGLLSMPALAGTTVEMFSGTGTLNVTLPGTPAGGGLDFDGTFQITSLDFAPGSVTFQGQPIDFDGTEADFLSTSYSGSSQVPVSSGPATVTATGTASTTGAVNGSWGLTCDSVDLGPGFSASNLDLGVGGSMSGTSSNSNWQSPAIPELNGTTVTVQTENTVLGVDAINGLVDMSYSGSIAASVGAAIPTVGEWGLMIMTVGLIGLAVLVIRRGALAM